MSVVTESARIGENVRVVDLEPLTVNSRKAAQLLDISPRKLQDLTAPRGPIKSVKIGRVHSYPVEHLRRYLRDLAAKTA
ncbi:hypothetical protein V7x_54790 [Crateriforma conspicua]|uniref:Helix-turn-helix domain protein n=1 Tax=Crateriforma conspicua TaxID=2527996 RepID=A0A5C6FGM0_9PLAN|nr:helix-turn-helix domain-containing protein [Crateriforma conspicua]TWU59705.1 hypothetical protein V7x_54790 [Crateriforma conspicua]